MPPKLAKRPDNVDFRAPRRTSPQIRAPEASSDEKPSFSESEYDMVFTTEPESEFVRQSDIIIALMGPTGAGKSSFINHVVGQERSMVGHHLVSCTYKIDIIRYMTEDNAQVVLIDTPGFNDTNLTDYAILVMITDWLAETYRQKIKLSGILYFHRISDNRMTGTLKHNLDMFRSLVGSKAFHNVSLVTTMWDAVVDSTGAVNEQQLRTFYWYEMIQKGSRLRRHDNTRESALRIISEFRAAPHPTSLLVQHEMVDLNRPLQETTVGRRLLEWFSHLLDRVKKRISKRVSGWTRALPAEVVKDKILAKDIEALTKTKWTSNFGASSSSSTLTASPRSSIDSSADDSVPPSPVLPLPQPAGIARLSSDDVLKSTITWLKHAQTLSTIAPVPGLRELVGLALVVARTVDSLWSMEDSLVLLSQNAAWFVSAIVHHVKRHPPSEELISHIASFTRDLGRVPVLVHEALKQPSLKRYMLSDKEKALVDTCNQAIMNSTQMLQIRIALSNSQAMQVMNDRLINVLHTGFAMMQEQMWEMSNRLNQSKSLDNLSSQTVVQPHLPRTFTMQCYGDMPPPSPSLCTLRTNFP